MAAPFFDNISGTVTSGPGTAAFTLTGAATGAEAWSTMPSNQIVHYRADEGTTWERGIGLWNGTTLTRNLEASSSGSLISFGTGVIVALDAPADEVQPHVGGGHWAMWVANGLGSVITSVGIASPVVSGTGAAPTFATTNYLTRSNRVEYTSGAAAGNLGGIVGGTLFTHLSSTAFMGGFEVSSRFGFISFASGPRLGVGMAASIWSGVEPSTVLNAAWFAKDSTDTNIQFMTNNGTTTTKLDTGMAPVAGAMYEVRIKAAPGAAKVFYQIIRLDTGAIFTGSTVTTLPTVDTKLGPQCQAAVGTTASALVFAIQKLYYKTSF